VLREELFLAQERLWLKSPSFPLTRLFLNLLFNKLNKLNKLNKHNTLNRLFRKLNCLGPQQVQPAQALNIEVNISGHRYAYNVSVSLFFKSAVHDS
jgi:hypothetical protein